MGKTSKLQIFIEWVIGLTAFLGIIFLLPNKQSVVETQQKAEEKIHFVIHESANDWEMFFAENELNEILTGETKEKIIEMLNEEFVNKTGDKQKNLNSEIDCDLPRPGDSIKHGESVLAYQQRTDVPSICNVERRTCYFGRLQGSFQQRSCKEDINYQYTETEVILYNEKVRNPYVQPDKLAKNHDANFSVDGKVNDPLIPRTTRNNKINDSFIREDTSKGFNDFEYKSCKTPRGDTIPHSQFVKAYKDYQGFVDRPCEVELRYCIDGNLEGSFEQYECQFIDLIEVDYEYGKKEGDDNPTVINLLDSLDWE